jgi:hypothetical protein
MKVYLSHFDRDELRDIAKLLREDGHLVHTSHEFVGEPDMDKRADIRMRFISEAEYFVFFASPEGTKQLVRSYEIGFAIGCETPVAFVGAPRNSYQRFGDVFDDTDAFLDAFLEDDEREEAYAHQLALFRMP